MGLSWHKLFRTIACDALYSEPRCTHGRLVVFHRLEGVEEPRRPEVAGCEGQARAGARQLLVQRSRRHLGEAVLGLRHAQAPLRLHEGADRAPGSYDQLVRRLAGRNELFFVCYAFLAALLPFHL